MQVGGFGDEVGLGQRQARIGLLGVDAAAHAGLDARLDLLGGLPVLHHAVLGERNQLAEALHVVERARSLQRGLLAGVEQLEITAQALVAGAALYLASDAASYTTGAILDVSGGR